MGKIGSLVRKHVPAILEQCAVDEDLFERLRDSGWSRSNLNLNYPFCQLAHAVPSRLQSRYWAKAHSVGPLRVRVTNDWHERNRAPFLAFLARRGIKVEGADEALGAAQRPPLPDSASAAATDNPIAIGANGFAPIDAVQQAMVHHLLGHLSAEPLSEGDRRELFAAFDGRCAYCDDPAASLGHLVPLTVAELGEHRRGNLVPVCASCEARKGELGYRQFVADDQRRLDQLEAHMARNGYAPLSPTAEIAEILTLAYHEVAQLAERYNTILSFALDRVRGAGEARRPSSPSTNGLPGHR